MAAEELLTRAKQALSRGDGNQAIAVLNALLRDQPQHPEALYLLALCAELAGRGDEAERLLALAYEADPRSAPIAFALGTYTTVRDPDRAMALFRAAISAQPDFAPALTAMGNQYRAKGLLGAARDHYQAALRADPTLVEVETNLGSVLHDQFAHRDALHHHDRAIAGKPDLALAHSNKLLGMHYADHVSPKTLYAEHLSWAETIEADKVGTLSSRNKQPHGKDANPDRPLRVGYLSPDFRVHPVGWFFQTLLAHHRSDRIESYCYALNEQSDEQTALIRAAALHWRPVSRLDDGAVADQIRHDGIDILVDLAGHTGGNRLGVFAGKPAPVQVTWLGYPDTTGMRAMDYRLTDKIADPDDSLASEELVRLEGGFLCYRAPVDVAVDKPAAVGRGVVFGSFNNLAKLNDAVVDCWAEILRRVPDSRLVLKARSFADPDTRARCVGVFGARGVDGAQLDLRDRTRDLRDSFAAYNTVDIALDPFPYNGTTTSFDALWMGTPVIALMGDRHSGRVGASILTHLGLDELIALSPGAYVDKAVALARDTPRRDTLTRSLRAQLESSPLMDAAGFAEKVEAAYRRMWRRWCAEADEQA